MESMESNKLKNITISYNGGIDKLFLIIYHGYDDFAAHEIVSEVKNKEEGIYLYNKQIIQ